MTIKKTDADLEYYKEFVNHGNDKDRIMSIPKLKRYAMLSFIICPALGIILTFVFRIDFVAVRIALAAIMVWARNINALFSWTGSLKKADVPKSIMRSKGC